MSLLTVDTKSELQTYENEACLYNIKLSLRKIGTYVVLAIWGSVFLGMKMILQCILIFYRNHYLSRDIWLESSYRISDSCCG